MAKIENVNYIIWIVLGLLLAVFGIALYARRSRASQSVSPQPKTVSTGSKKVFLNLDDWKAAILCLIGAVAIFVVLWRMPLPTWNYVAYVFVILWEFVVVMGSSNDEPIKGPGLLPVWLRVTLRLVLMIAGAITLLAGVVYLARSV